MHMNHKNKKEKKKKEKENHDEEESEAGLHCERLRKKGDIQEEEERAYEEGEWIEHPLRDWGMRHRV